LKNKYLNQIMGINPVLEDQIWKEEFLAYGCVKKAENWGQNGNGCRFAITGNHQTI
jgi:hypothetical protein